MPPPRGIPRRYGDTNLYTWLFSLLRDNFLQIYQTQIIDNFYWIFCLTFCFLFSFHMILKHFGWIWPILLMRFWHNRFLKGQTTSDGTEIFFSLLSRYFSTTLLYQILFLTILQLFFTNAFLDFFCCNYEFYRWLKYRKFWFMVPQLLL